MPPEHTRFARALRNNPTDTEFVLWRVLSQVRPRFTRQLKLHPYTADAVCRKAKLIVEIDGSQHAGSFNDVRRTTRLQADGWAVIRFWNNEVLTNVEGVVAAIFEAGNPRLPPGNEFEFVVSRAGRERKPRTRAPNEEKSEEEPTPNPSRKSGRGITARMM